MSTLVSKNSVSCKGGTPLSATNQPTIAFQETHTPTAGNFVPTISWDPGPVLETSEYWNQITDSLQIPIIVTAQNQCHSARDTVVVTLKVEPSVEIAPHDRYVIDGTTNSTYELQISPPGVSGTFFQWTGNPENTPAGNDPEVVFLPDRFQQNVTVANAKWYAFPDDSCWESNLESSYRLRAETIINDLPYADEAWLTVYVPMPMGETPPPGLTGEPDYAPVLDANGDTVKWKVHSQHTLTRTVGRDTVYLPGTSQFYHKIAVHEGVHVQQQVSGIARDIFSADKLWRILRLLEAPTYEELDIGVNKTMFGYYIVQLEAWINGKNAREIEAFAASDPIPPRYFQGCGSTEY